MRKIMNLFAKQSPIFCVLLSSVMISACSEDEAAAILDEIVPPETAEVSVDFAAQVNGADFACGDTYTGIGTGGDDYKITDFRMYVHDAHIKDPLTSEKHAIELTQDGVWQRDNVALLDFEDGCGTGTPETNNVLAGKVTVPATVDLDDAEICFTVGVPVDKNHLDVSAVESPLNDSSMYWAWKIGYKYIRIDGMGDPAGTATPFVLHLGAQGCPDPMTKTEAPATPCTEPNTFEVCVANFDVVNDVIAVDPARVFEGNDMKVNSAGTKAGCMSFVGDDDCEEIMPRLGLDYDYGRSLTGVKSIYDAGQRLVTKQ